MSNTNKFWQGTGQAHEFAQKWGEIGGNEADITALIQNPKKLKSVLRFARGTAKIVEVEKPEILKLLGTVVLPATTNNFIPKNNFIIDMSKAAEVKISHICNDFQNRLLRKVEVPIKKETIIHYHELLVSESLDQPIIAKLGKNGKAETTLANIYALMRLQGNGEEGVLLTDGFSNVFYVRDITNKLLVVNLNWFGNVGKGWNVEANSFAHLVGHFFSTRIFSQNS